MSARQAFRGTVCALGAVATAAGLHTVLTGARSIPAVSRSADSRIESELRFYAAFYVAYGLAALRIAPRADSEEETVRTLAAAMLLAGVARTAAWRDAGRPSEAQLALLAVELAGPPALVAWQARLR